MEDDRILQIDDVVIRLARPTELPAKWIGQEEVIKQLLAAWMVVDESDLPLNPRIVGKPGVGKTTLGYCAGDKLGRPVYLFQATMDTRPEDLIVTPVISPDGKIQYMASTVVSAAVKGGVCILDEGNRMSEKAWASLAPLLDGRRYVESLVAGVTIPAHPAFRFATTMNDDASTYELPEYIHSRLQPQILVDFAEPDEERLILKENLPFVDDWILDYVVNFLEQAHKADERYTVRDGINIARYAAKMLKDRSEDKGSRAEEVMREAFLLILGEEALSHIDE